MSKDGLNYYALKKKDGTAVGPVDVTSIKGQSLQLPVEIFSSRYTRIVSDASEAAERTIEVCTSG